MGFADRAIAACDRAMSEGTLSDRHVRDVLRCGRVDAASLVRHLRSENPIVRLGAARIIGRMGDVRHLLDAATRENDSVVLRGMLCILGEHKEGAKSLARMVNSNDDLVREEAISMLRRSGNAESLFPLLFSENDALVERIKRYINEQERRQRTEDANIGKSC